MTMPLVRRSANVPLILALWTLTLLSLLPFTSLPFLLIGCMSSLISNGLAVLLLFQPGFTNRLNGGIRLALQGVILIVGCFLILRHGLTPTGMLESLLNRLH